MTNRERNEPQAALWERCVIAVVLGLLGLVTGVLSVWMLTNLPGLDIPGAVYLGVGVVAGIACLVLGFVAERRTVDVLGEIWQVVWKLSVGVLSAIRMFAR